MQKLQAGDPAPSFTAPDQDGHPVGLKDFKGRPCFIFFYPKANTSGCTAQAQAVRDALAELTEAGVAVIGISPDAVPQQKKFHDKHALGFPLLSDGDHKIAEAYGVWGEKKMYGKTFMGIVRSAFLVDAQGKIAGAAYKVSPKDTVPTLKTWLAA